MGFMFRLCFWLAVTVMIMPPDERPGALAGTGEINLQERFQATVGTAWSIVSGLSTTCTDNPKLCEAAQALAQTTAATGEALMSQTSAPPAPAAAPQTTDDGRVGRPRTPG